MRAKEYLLIFCLLTAISCTNAKRFLPPGFVKYEDLAKDQPVSEELREDIEAQETRKGRKFPRLSAQPDAAPSDVPDAVVRAGRSAELEMERTAILEAIEEDRARALAEREGDEMSAAAEPQRIPYLGDDFER